jgi:hypothetical protein
MIKQPPANYSVSTYQASANFGIYGTTLYFHDGSWSIYYDTGTAWSAAQVNIALTPHTNANRAPFMEFAQNLYLGSINGVYFIDAVGGTFIKAGFSTPTPPANLSVSSGTGSWTWATSNPTSKVAYRVVWGRKDAHQRIIYSEPSAREVATNSTTADRHVLGDVPAIPETSSSTFYQVFRSWSVDATVTGATPSDNLYQVYEGMGADSFTGATGSFSKAAGSAVTTVTKVAHGYRTGMKVYFTFAAGDQDADEFLTGLFEVTVSSTSIFTYNDSKTNTTGAPILNAATVAVAPKYYPFRDFSPDDILSVPLYTNPIDGDGFAAANAEPPACADMCIWKGRAWYANSNRRHSYTIQLIGTHDGAAAGSPDGLQAADTITVNSMAFVGTAGAATYGTLQFQVYTAGTAAANISQTALALVGAVNNYTGNTTIRATYIQ